MITLLLIGALSASLQSAPPPAAASSEKKVCRSDHVVGSRVPTKRTCRTQAEWDKLDRGMDAASRIQMEQSLGLGGRMMNPGGN